MAAQSPPPPPGAGAPAPNSRPGSKKGLHPLAWVAIGCLVLVVFGGVVTVVGGYFVARKAKQVFTEGDPAMTAAEAIVRLNPDLELVESDADSRTLTVRDKNSGEVATLNLSAIQEGRFEFESGGKTVSIDAAGGGDNLVTVTEEGEDGAASSSTLQIGSSGGIPEGTPVYPGAEPQPLFSMTENGMTSGSYRIETSDPFDTLLAFYEAYAADAGLEVERSVIDAGGRQLATLQTQGGNDTTGFTAMIQDDGETRSATVTYRRPER